MATYRNLHTPTLTGVNIVQVAGAFNIDPTMTDFGVEVSAGDVATIKLDTPQPEVWFHFVVRTSQGGNGGTPNRAISVIDTAGNILVSLRVNGGRGIIQFIDAFNTVANVTVGQIFGGEGLNATTQYAIDIRVQSGSFDLYIDDRLHFSATGLVQPGFNIDRCELRARISDINAASIRKVYSEFAVGIGGNSITVGARVRTRFPTANGALTAWATSGFANVDDGPVINDGVFATSNVAGDRSSYTVPVPTGNLPIETVQIFSSALHDGVGVADYRHFARLVGINYDQSLLGPGLTLGQQISTLAVSPATGVPWTFAELSTLEIGILSA